MTTKQYRQSAEASARAATEKENATAGNRGAGAKQNEQFNFTPEYPMTGWRGALAAGNGQFRIAGTYDAVAPMRTFRRRVQRMLAKQGSKK